MLVCGHSSVLKSRCKQCRHYMCLDCACKNPDAVCPKCKANQIIDQPKSQTKPQGETPMVDGKPNALISIGQASKMTGWSNTALTQWVKDGKIKGFKEVGGKQEWRLQTDSLLAYVNKVGPKTGPKANGNGKSKKSKKIDGHGKPFRSTCTICNVAKAGKWFSDTPGICLKCSTEQEQEPERKAAKPARSQPAHEVELFEEEQKPIEKPTLTVVKENSPPDQTRQLQRLSNDLAGANSTIELLRQNNEQLIEMNKYLSDKLLKMLSFNQ